MFFFNTVYTPCFFCADSGNGKTLEMRVRSIGDSLNRERGRETVNGWG